MKKLILYIIPLLSLACQPQDCTYEEVHKHISKSSHVIELSSADGKERLMLSETYQGRILTSSFNGKEGESLGWLNPEMWDNENLSGPALHGEERVWIGPLGGQYSFYYGQSQPLDEQNWSVPLPFNDEPYRIVSFNRRALCFEKRMQLTNHGGNTLSMLLKRDVSLLSHHSIAQYLSLPLWDNSIDVVAYEVNSRLYNSDSVVWSKDKGLASIWELTTLPASDESYVLIPMSNAAEDEVNMYLNPKDNKRVSYADRALRYKVDGRYRHKIGVNHSATQGLLASYCAKREVLTIIQFQQSPEDSLYFNSLVEVQDDPYKGETVSVYNHGPMDLSLGAKHAFYELETTSAMRELAPGECIEHYHRVYHFGGDEQTLEHLAQKALGLSLYSF